MSLNYRTFTRTALSHQICLSQRCLSRIGLPLLLCKNTKGPKPGEHVQVFCMKRDCNKGFYSAKCRWRPPWHFALNGLVILCLGMCHRHFTIWWHTPNGVSNKHSCWDHIFLRTKVFVGHGWGGGRWVDGLCRLPAPSVGEECCQARAATTLCRFVFQYISVMAKKECACAMIIMDHPNAIWGHKKN